MSGRAEAAVMALNSLLEGLKGNLNLSVLKLDGVEWRDLRFPNDESYRGGWKDSRVRGTAAVPAGQPSNVAPRIARLCAVHAAVWLSPLQPARGTPSAGMRSAFLSSHPPALPNACSLRAKAATRGQTGAPTRAPGMRASSTDGASTAGQTARGTKESGGTASWRWVLRP